MNSPRRSKAHTGRDEAQGDEGAEGVLAPSGRAAAATRHLQRLDGARIGEVGHVEKVLLGRVALARRVLALVVVREELALAAARGEDREATCGTQRGACKERTQPGSKSYEDQCKRVCAHTYQPWLDAGEQSTYERRRKCLLWSDPDAGRTHGAKAHAWK
eukprot:3820751-Pleurochrysis_carterae.AAC.3